MFPMLEPGPLTALLGGQELLVGGQLQDHGQHKSMVIIMLSQYFTIFGALDRALEPFAFILQNLFCFHTSESIEAK